MYSPQNALRHPVEVELGGEVGVAQHVDAAPELGLVAGGAAPGAAHLAGPHQDVDEVELAEDA